MFKQFITKVAKMQERRVAYYLLQSLSDRQLKDMGVTRGELRQRVYSD